MSKTLIIYGGSLAHHGIKGQKWGVRRFQNEDGSYTRAGKQRYGFGNLKQRFASNKQSGERKPGLIQRHRENLTSKYMEQGYSESAAKVKAEQRMRTEAVVAAIGAVAITAVAIKASRRIGQDYFDKTFKSGQVIQNIGANPNANFKDTPFFAAVNNHDKKAYGMMYPNEKRNMVKNGGGPYGYQGIYNNQIKFNQDVKRASVNNARKIFYEKMDNDPDYRRRVMDTLSKTNYKDRVAMYQYSKNGKHSKKLYDRFNQALATPQFQSAGLHNEYYNELKKHGYNAILDINDTRYSGYKKISQNPTIFFGDDKWSKISSKKLSDREIDSNVLKYAYGNVVAKNLAKRAAVVYRASTASNTLTEQKMVDNYLKQHPNSKLSRKEIIDNANRGTQY